MTHPKCPKTVLIPIHGGKWSATMQTATGPVTATGDSIGEAQQGLDTLRMIARALDVTRDRQRHDR